jgi:hypothetical protein
MRFHKARSTKDLDLTVRSVRGRAEDSNSLRERLQLAASTCFRILSTRCRARVLTRSSTPVRHRQRVSNRTRGAAQRTGAS